MLEQVPTGYLQFHHMHTWCAFLSPYFRGDVISHVTQAHLLIHSALSSLMPAADSGQHWGGRQDLGHQWHGSHADGRADCAWKHHEPSHVIRTATDGWP